MVTKALGTQIRCAVWIVVGASLIVLVSAGGVGGQATDLESDSALTSPYPPAVSAFRGEPNQPSETLQGGDNFTNAFVIGSLPFSDVGTTRGYNDDCPDCFIFFEESPDVVYAFTPVADVIVEVSSCGSLFDTHVAVYSQASGDFVACNEDFCGTNAHIQEVALQAGTKYYIIIDGRGGSYGDYQLHVKSLVPCGIVCPPNATPESETCVTGGLDSINIGCNSTTAVFSQIDCGDTICGTSYSSTTQRDTDWYRKTFTENTTVTWTVVADFPASLLIYRLPTGCSGRTTVINTSATPCDTTSVTVTLLSGTYGFYIAPLGWVDAYSCERGPWNYSTWLSCQPALPPPPNDVCTSAIEIGEVNNLPFTTLSATYDNSNTCTSRPEVWYCYTASYSGTLFVTACGSNYPVSVNIFEGCNCQSSTRLHCYANNCGKTTRVGVNVTAGTSYLLSVSTSNGATGTGTLTLECMPYPEQSFCANVVPSSLPATFSGDNTGAASECELVPRPHVWHAFTLDECMDVTLDFCGSYPPFPHPWSALIFGCPCDSTTFPGEYGYSTCGDGSVTYRWKGLPAGTYYYPVLSEPYSGLGVPYILNVTGTPSRCRPCYTSGSWGTYPAYISKVSVGTIEQYSGWSSYTDYTTLSTQVWKRMPCIIEVWTGWYIPVEVDCGVWADWNSDFDFDDTGERFLLNKLSNGALFKGYSIPPDGPGLDTVALRVRIISGGSENELVPPCGLQEAAGEVEDYTLILKHFDCGDWNGDGLINQADIQATINYYFNSASCPEPCEVADVNCDGTSNLADILYLIKHVYGGGAAPCCGQ